MNIHISQEEEFSRILNNVVQISNYEFKYLKWHLTLFQNGQVEYYSESLFNTRDGAESGWVLLLFSDIIMVYGSNWDLLQLEEIKQTVDLSKFTNHRITGDAKLVMALLKVHKVDDFKIVKERVFYRTNEIKVIDPKDTRIDQPGTDDAPELALMLKQYYHEEYSGKRDREISEMDSVIREHIKNKTIYVLRNERQELLSFCTIVDPDIGILFTNTNHRRSGYGKILLSYCSQILLKRNDEVFLMTDRAKIESNTLCQYIGFRAYFDYVYLLI